MNDLPFPNQMFQVIDALLSGANLTEAAAAAGVHRNTVANWRRNSPEFQQALAHAQSDRDFLYRERAADLADLAFTSLREILSDPKASPSVRFKAATFIIQTAIAPPPYKPKSPAAFEPAFHGGQSQIRTKIHRPSWLYLYYQRPTRETKGQCGASCPPPLSEWRELFGAVRNSPGPSPRAP
jgi:transposase-like protein